jgi:hypothetical protein
MNEWGHHLYFAYRGDTEGPTNFWGFDEDFDFVQRGAVLKITLLTKPILNFDDYVATIRLPRQARDKHRKCWVGLGEKAVWSAGASRDRTTPVGAWMRATKTGALKVAVLGGGNGSNGGNGDDAELRPTWSASELTDCGYRRTVDLDLDMTLLRDEAAVEEASAVAKGRIASNLVRNAHLLSCHSILKMIICLPRQARDKHGENSTKKFGFSQALVKEQLTGADTLRKYPFFHAAILQLKK